MLKILKNIIFPATFIFAFMFANLFCGVAEVFAQAPGPAQVDLGLQFAQETGLTTTDIRVVIANIIRVAFGLLGIAGVAIVIYGGFIWMTSGGDKSKIDQAKKILINGAIGLAIVLSAFAITEFVIRTVLGQSGAGSNSSSSSGGSQAAGGGFSGGALGRVISAHYPDRGASDVARNTKVIVTFVEKVKSSTIFDTNVQAALQKPNINFKNVKIYKTSDAKKGGLPPDDSKLIQDVIVNSSDQLSYIFSFQNYLGSPSEKVGYSVYLGPGIQKNNGQGVFGGLSGSYVWQFETGTSIDITPPQVESVSPTDPQGCPSDIDKCSPRNEVIQIHFNEAIDPTTVTGIVPGFAKIGSTPKVDGEFLITNGYRTVTFIPKASCGGVSKNSCGDPVFCLPGKTKLKFNINAAKLNANQKGTAQASIPYSGVVDVAGNSLDGQGGPIVQPPKNPDGKAQGPPADNYAWEFTTSDKIDLTPPKILTLSPDVDTGKVALDKDMLVTFDKDLLASSLFGGVQVLFGDKKTPNKRSPWAGAYTTSLGRNKSGTVNPKLLSWSHYDNLFGSTNAKTFYYYPSIFSTIKDSRQNCFNPVQGPVTTSSSKKCEESGNDWKLGSKVGTYPYECDLAK